MASTERMSANSCLADPLSLDVLGHLSYNSWRSGYSGCRNFKGLGTEVSEAVAVRMSVRSDSSAGWYSEVSGSCKRFQR